MIFAFDPEYISQRLTEIAPETRNLSVVVQDDESTWTLAFEDEMTVLVLLEWVDQPRRLVLSADIGKPPAERAADIHAAALSYNMLWRDTGGARIGMGGEDGDLLLIRDIDAQSVQGNEFILLLERFADLAQWWENFVTSERTGLFVPQFGMTQVLARA